MNAPAERGTGNGGIGLTVAALPFLVVIAGAIIGWIGYRNLSASAQALAQRRLQDNAETAERLIAAIDRIAGEVARRLAARAEVMASDAGAEAWCDELATHLAGQILIQRLAVLSADGDRVDLWRDDDGLNILEERRAGRLRRLSLDASGALRDLPAPTATVAIPAVIPAAAQWSGPDRLPGSPRSGLTLTHPLRDGRRAVQVRLGTDEISQAIATLVASGAQILIHDDRGAILAASTGVAADGPAVPTLDTLGDPAVAAYRAAPPGTARLDTAGGETWLLHHHTIPGGDRTWHYAAMMPLQPLLAEALGYRNRTILIATVVSAIAALIAIVLARRLLRATDQARRARSEARQALAEAEALGSYRLEAKLGAGGMGEVWRATHRLLARPAAIKLIKRDQEDAERPEVAQRFEREARLTASLTSPHTVTVFDFGQLQDGTIYYAMELLEGRDLDSILRDHGPLPQEAVVHVLIAACDSLGEAHAKGLIHRDLKPANIFISARGMRRDLVKILDFGLVALTGKRRNAVPRLTQQGFVQGTPGFMSPEQLRDEELDARSDLCALGCVAFWLLTGRAVFPAATLMEELQRHLEEAAAKPSTCTSRPIAAGLDEVVVDLLATDRTQRIASTEVLLRRLRACGVAPAFDVALLGPTTGAKGPDIAVGEGDRQVSAGMQVRIRR